MQKYNGMYNTLMSAHSCQQTPIWLTLTGTFAYPGWLLMIVLNVSAMQQMVWMYMGVQN